MKKMQYAFGKHVFAFITKDHLETDLPYMLDKIITDMYHYTFIDDLYNSTHVSYIEAAHNYCYLYLNSGEKILVSHRISELAEMLCEYDFVKIHRSYLVNLNYLIDYKNTYIIIKTDTTDSIQLPISVRLRNEFKNLYKIYSRKKMRYTQ